MDEFKMSAYELDLLASLKGSELRAVVERAWAIHVYTGTASVSLLPQETTFGGCSFIRVAAASGAEDGLTLRPFDNVVASDRPEIVSVAVAELALGWVPRGRAERRDARRYTGDARLIPVYRAPDDPDLARDSARLGAKGGTGLVLVDVAVVITTSDHRTVTIYSDEAAFFVHAMDGLKAGHVPLDIARRRSA